MPSYNTITADEKSSLLGSGTIQRDPELFETPIFVDYYRHETRCSCKARGSRGHRVGCCARLCQLLMWVVFCAIAAIVYFRYMDSPLKFPSFWNLGSPVEVPVAVTKCPSAPVTYKAGEHKYAFDLGTDNNPDSFYFGQRWIRKSKAGSAARFIQTAGEVIVQAAPVDSVDAVTVDFDIKLSHEELADAISIKREPAGLVFESSTFLEGFTGTEPCISVVATISVSPSMNISSFNINTLILPIQLKKSLQLTSGNIFLHSTASSISSETTFLNSKTIEVETTSSPISGNFPLAKLLSLKSVSGAVTVDVEPKESEPEDFAGSLVIRTDTGSIQVNTATSNIPNRKFISQVHSVSGSVSGTFLLGVTSNINSVNGAIDADFHTAGDLANRSCIVNSVSGSVRSKILDESYSIGNVYSHFQSQSGLLDISFPAAWQGGISGETKSGSIDISGDDIKIIKDIRPVPSRGRIIVARKGDGYSNLSVETVSSAISVKFA